MPTTRCTRIFTRWRLVFFQVAKNCQVFCQTVRGVFLMFLPKIKNDNSICQTAGDAQESSPPPCVQVQQVAAEYTPHLSGLLWNNFQCGNYTVQSSGCIEKCRQKYRIMALGVFLNWKLQGKAAPCVKPSTFPFVGVGEYVSTRLRCCFV